MVKKFATHIKPPKGEVVVSSASASWRRKGRFEVIGFGTTLTAEVRCAGCAGSAPCWDGRHGRIAGSGRSVGLLKAFFWGGFSLKQLYM